VLRELKVSPEADAAMAKLVELFSDPNFPSKARFRCGVKGPDEFDVLFESTPMSSSAIIQIVNINVGSEVFIASA
jgi:hypothetical protein